MVHFFALLELIIFSFVIGKTSWTYNQVNYVSSSKAYYYEFDCHKICQSWLEVFID